MKKIIEEYKREIKDLVTNPKYIAPIIFVAILSYGFAVTHYSIGIDDLCFDRYISGTYILSAKRWGTWLLYNVLNIKEFTPFWMDFVVSVFMVIIAIVLSAFLKKQLKDKINVWECVIFSSIFISNPIIGHFFIYQTTNLAVAICNLLMIISAIIIIENYFENKKINIYMISIFLIIIALSMYESCAQTYLVLIFIYIFIKLVNKDEKNIFKFFCVSIGCLIIGILGYFLIGKIIILILTKLNIKKPNLASGKFVILNKQFRILPLENKKRLWEYYWFDFTNTIIYDMKNYYPFQIFVILSIIAVIMEIVKSYKTNKDNRLITVILMILSNIFLMIGQIKILYRIQFSWILTISFLILYIYKTFEDKKKLKIIMNFVILLLIIFQTKNLNQYFYKEYKRYEREKIAANNIAMDIIKETDYESKPIVYVNTLKNVDLTDDEDIKSAINWGILAFYDSCVETTKFINNFGYSFLSISIEDYKESNKQYEILDEETKNKNIIELSNCIIVNLDKY